MPLEDDSFDILFCEKKREIQMPREFKFNTFSGILLLIFFSLKVGGIFAIYSENISFWVSYLMRIYFDS